MWPGAGDDRIRHAGSVSSISMSANGASCGSADRMVVPASASVMKRKRGIETELVDRLLEPAQGRQLLDRVVGAGDDAHATVEQLLPLVGVLHALGPRPFFAVAASEWAKPGWMQATTPRCAIRSMRWGASTWACSMRRGRALVAVDVLVGVEHRLDGAVADGVGGDSPALGSGSSARRQG